MARPLRIQFPGAIYHVMARGNDRQLLFKTEGDYERMTEGLQKTVLRTGWEVFSYVWMPNHIHLVFRIVEANLSRGMQYLLSGYANWHAVRHTRVGHLFQGRFKGELIQDESYLWTATRYVHLNPARGKKPLVANLRDWPWSSYSGYASSKQRVEWIQYETLYQAWQGENGGKDPQRLYRRYVEEGLQDPPENPFAAALEGWLLGSVDHLKMLKAKFGDPTAAPQTAAHGRKFRSLAAEDVIAAVASYHGVSPEAYRTRRSTAPGRDMAAYLSHRRTTASLRQLAEPFGLGNPDSVSNLIRRAELALAESESFRSSLQEIESRLSDTDNRS